MHAIGDYGASAVPAFLHKLWALVEDEDTNELIAWDPSGLSFHVFDQGRFAKEILPLYFKHNNIASFIRQLNMYGFRKVASVDHGGLKTEKDDMEFSHIYFQRDQEAFLEHIKRKVTTGVKGEDVKIKHDDVNKVLMDVHHLRGKQDTINTKFDTLKRENEALWREVASLRQKHLKQQQIVNKLIQFLVTIVGSGRGLAGMKRPARMPLMLQDASEADRGVRPTKVARRQEQSKPDTDAKTELNIPSARQPLSSVQIQKMMSSNTSSPQQTAEPVMSLPSKPQSESPDTAAQSYIVINIPQQTGDEVIRDVDSVPTSSPPPYCGIVTSPQSTSDVMSPANITDQSLDMSLANEKFTFSPDGMSELDLSALDPNTICDSSAINVDNNRLISDIDLNDPVLQSLVSNSNTAVAVSPHHHTVNTMSDDVDTIHDSLEDLRGLLGASGGVNLEPNSSLFGFPLDRETLHGLFTPEAPVPPTPEPLLNMGGQADEEEPNYSEATANADNQMVQYVPSEDFSSLFDLDLDNAPYLPDLSSLQEEADLSTPIYNLTSPLAERRKSKQSTSTTTTTDEID